MAGEVSIAGVEEGGEVGVGWDEPARVEILLQLTDAVNVDSKQDGSHRAADDLEDEKRDVSTVNVDS